MWQTDNTKSLFNCFTINRKYVYFQNHLCSGLIVYQDYGPILLYSKSFGLFSIFLTLRQQKSYEARLSSLWNSRLLFNHGGIIGRTQFILLPQAYHWHSLSELSVVWSGSTITNHQCDQSGNELTLMGEAQPPSRRTLSTLILTLASKELCGWACNKDLVGYSYYCLKKTFASNGWTRAIRQKWRMKWQLKGVLSLIPVCEWDYYDVHSQIKPNHGLQPQ